MADPNSAEGRALNFLDQLKLQALRRYEEEKRTYSTALNDHATALEAMVSNVADGIVLVEVEDRSDPQLRMQYVNPSFCKLLGYAAEDILGMPLSTIFCPDTVDSTMSAIVQTLIEEGHGQVETLCSRRDRTQFMADIRLFPIPHVLRRPAKWFFEIRDVSASRAEAEMMNRLQAAESENKRLEAELAESRSEEARLKLGLIHDPVTGTVNASYFRERITEALGRTQTRPGSTGYVLSVGLENYDELRDTMGDSAADHVLLETAHKLRRGTPSGTTIARVQPAEFFLLLEGVDSVTALETSNTLIRSLAQGMEILGRSIAVVPNLGLCTIDASSRNAEQIMHDAGAAMARAKQQGGARTVWFEEAVNVRTMALLRTKSELEDALRMGHIEVYYQPQLDVRTVPPKLCAVEALVRWNHPKQGMLAADRILPTAEKSGIIVPLGLHVMRTACWQMKRWQSNVMFPDISLILNVSASQLTHPDFFSEFVDILAENTIDAHILELDVSESAFTQINQAVLDLLQQLRQLGVKVVLDNWGRCDTSIVQLDKYPISAIKLDRSVVNSLERGTSKIALTRLVLSYAQSLGLASSAQGVSSAFESKTLQNCGCSVQQGFLYSAPASADQITKLLDQGTRMLIHA